MYTERVTRKRVIVVSKARTNVFQHLPYVEHYTCWSDAIRALTTSAATAAAQPRKAPRRRGRKSMSRRHPNDNDEQKAARRARSTVLVRLDQVIPEVRAEIIAEWDRREAKARELRKIKGNEGRTDANAFPSEGETLGRGAMKRGKNTVAAAPSKAKRTLGGDFVRADEDDNTVADGTTDDRVEIGEFVRKPQPKPVTF
jgi:hypothetical protein